MLAENELVRDFVGVMCEEKFKGSACVRWFVVGFLFCFFIAKMQVLG